MMGARALVSPAVRVARRTRQPLCAAFWFAAPLRPAFDTRPVGVGCIERRVPRDALRLRSFLLVSLQAASSWLRCKTEPHELPNSIIAWCELLLEPLNTRPQLG